MTTPDRQYLDIHILQSVPPSCINRGEDGRPKTAIFGGTTRLRVSSQAYKRATRIQGRDTDAVRSRRLGVEIERMLNESGLMNEHLTAAQLAPEVYAAAFGTNKAETEKTLLLVGYRTLNQVVETVLVNLDVLRGAWALQPAETETESDPKNKGKGKNKADSKGSPLAAALKTLELPRFVADDDSADVALYGRMVAAQTAGYDLSVDAALQVAHAISTHGITTESDYFTAVDDLIKADESGAGMIGDVDFTSGVLYRYANASVHALASRLGRDRAVETVTQFVSDFARAMPTGRLNTFANGVPPAMIVVILRTDSPSSYVNAFEKPVTDLRSHGYLDGSIEALVEYHQAVDGVWSDPGEVIGVVAPMFSEWASKLGPVYRTLVELQAAIDSRL